MISHDCGVEGVKVIDICRGFSESTVGEAEGGAEFEVAIVLTTHVIPSQPPANTGFHKVPTSCTKCNLARNNNLKLKNLVTKDQKTHLVIFSWISRNKHFS